MPQMSVIRDASSLAAGVARMGPELALRDAAQTGDPEPICPECLLVLIQAMD